MLSQEAARAPSKLTTMKANPRASANNDNAGDNLADDLEDLSIEEGNDPEEEEGEEGMKLMSLASIFHKSAPDPLGPCGHAQVYSVAGICPPGANPARLSVTLKHSSACIMLTAPCYPSESLNAFEHLGPKCAGLQQANFLVSCWS